MLTTIQANKASQASFTAIAYSVTATAGTGGSASCDPASVSYNGSSTCTATPSNGYSFASWSGDCAGRAPPAR